MFTVYVVFLESVNVSVTKNAFYVTVLISSKYLAKFKTNIWIYVQSITSLNFFPSSNNGLILMVSVYKGIIKFLNTKCVCVCVCVCVYTVEKVISNQIELGLGGGGLGG